MGLRNANFQAKANIKKAAEEEVINCYFQIYGFFIDNFFGADIMSVLIEIFDAIRSFYSLNLRLNCTTQY